MHTYNMDGHILTCLCVYIVFGLEHVDSWGQVYRRIYDIDVWTNVTTIATLYDVTLMQCGVQCSNEPVCGAYNAMVTYGMCQLIQGVPEVAELTPQHGGVIYIKGGRSMSQLPEDRLVVDALITNMNLQAKGLYTWI